VKGEEEEEEENNGIGTRAQKRNVCLLEQALPVRVISLFFGIWQLTVVNRI
jgi:hypothetical protein